MQYFGVCLSSALSDRYPPFAVQWSVRTNPKNQRSSFVFPPGRLKHSSSQWKIREILYFCCMQNSLAAGSHVSIFHTSFIRRYLVSRFIQTVVGLSIESDALSQHRCQSVFLPASAVFKFCLFFSPLIPPNTRFFCPDKRSRGRFEIVLKRAGNARSIDVRCWLGNRRCMMSRETGSMECCFGNPTHE